MHRTCSHCEAANLAAYENFDIFSSAEESLTNIRQIADSYLLSDDRNNLPAQGSRKFLIFYR